MAKIKAPNKVVHRKLGRERAWGSADIGANKIELDERLSGYQYLLYTLHEHFHLRHPDWSETRVRKESSATARQLWSMGFRWVDLK